MRKTLLLSTNSNLKAVRYYKYLFVMQKNAHKIKNKKIRRYRKAKSGNIRKCGIDINITLDIQTTTLLYLYRIKGVQKTLKIN